jgi:long-chain acyl-CoA synthetase
MTEGWAISHMGQVGNLKPGWIGPPVPGVEQRLTSEGEILVRTPGMMLGYYKAPEFTTEVIDDERWLHTGDRGEIDADGRLRITGRLKELFKTSKGKYVAPAPIENRLLAYHRIEQACVLGAGMPQPYAIVVLSKRPAKKPPAASTGHSPRCARRSMPRSIRTNVCKRLSSLASRGQWRTDSSRRR